jgi:hypothetical protein
MRRGYYYLYKTVISKKPGLGSHNLALGCYSFFFIISGADLVNESSTISGIHKIEREGGVATRSLILASSLLFNEWLWVCCFMSNWNGHQGYQENAQNPRNDSDKSVCLLVNTCGGFTPRT